jgi:ABC-type uncharacterized transport system ATPase subunit
MPTSLPDENAEAASAAIVARNLTRRFQGFTAVDRVDLTVQPGQFFGFLGPNGADRRDDRDTWERSVSQPN